MKNLVMALTTGAALCGLGLLANAAAPDDTEPEARAYMSFKFGGAAPTTESFFYGLRLDRGAQSADVPHAPVMDVAFDRRGLASATLNGMPLQRMLRLNQAETQWTWTDWGLLAAGAVALGFVVVEVADAEEESPDPEGGTTTGDTTGGDTTGGDTGGLLGGALLGGGFRAEYGDHALHAVERQRVLDGGTGYMGDLIPETP
ncbi:MAG: hypothetical protein ACLGI7_07065 [Gammaproteobacteria bacterium]